MTRLDSGFWTMESAVQDSSAPSRRRRQDASKPVGRWSGLWTRMGGAWMPLPRHSMSLMNRWSLNFLAKLLTYMDKVLVGGASAFWMSHGSKLAPSRDSPLASASSWPAVCLVFLDRALATSGRTHTSASSVAEKSTYRSILTVVSLAGAQRITSIIKSESCWRTCRVWLITPSRSADDVIGEKSGSLPRKWVHHQYRRSRCR